MQLNIRRYRPSDKDTVLKLFSAGIQEHIGPCFQNAISSPLHIISIISLCFIGYLLHAPFGALLLPAAWAAFIYCCCHYMFAGYVRERLQTDMQDIVGNYLSRPDDCFWVAEADLDGTAQIVGMAAVMCKGSGKEKHGELFRMIISPQCRRMRLGHRMTQTAIDFCKERGFSKLELETSSTQMAAVALYKKLGFLHVLSHRDAHAPYWLVSLIRVTIIKMEKHL